MRWHKKIGYILLTSYLALSLPQRVTARVWTAKTTGQTIDAKFIRYEGDLVYLQHKDGGRRFKIRIENLEQRDRDYLDAYHPREETALPSTLELPNETRIEPEPSQEIVLPSISAIIRPRTNRPLARSTPAMTSRQPPTSASGAATNTPPAMQTVPVSSKRGLSLAVEQFGLPLVLFFMVVLVGLLAFTFYWFVRLMQWLIMRRDKTLLLINARQQIAIALLAPFLFFVLCYGIINGCGQVLYKSWQGPAYPFTHLNESWWMWAFAVAITITFEYYWLMDLEKDKD